MAITRLGAHGGPRGSLGGSFPPRLPEAPTTGVGNKFGKTFYGGRPSNDHANRRLHMELRARILREDDEIMALIHIIGKHLL